MVNAKPLCDARDVVEIADDLRGHGDLFVGEAVIMQLVNVLSGQRSWGECQFNGVVAQRAIRGRETCLPIVECQLPRDGLISGLQTEVLGV